MKREKAAQGRRPRWWSFSWAEIKVQAWAVVITCGALVVVHYARRPAEADFTHFYTLGTVAAARDAAALYDPLVQDALFRRVIPSAPDGWFLPVHPPQVSLIFAPLSFLSYRTAALLWGLFTLGVYAWFVRNGSVELKRFSPAGAMLLAFAFPPLWQLLRYLQATPILLAGMGFAWMGFSRRRPFLAGVGIGLLAVKPHYGIVPAIVMLACGEWRVVGGAVASVGAQLLAGASWFGPAVLVEYVKAVIRGARLGHLLDAQPHHLHSLSGFFQLLMPRAVAWYPVALLSVVALVLCVRSWRSAAPLELRFASLLLGIVLISPHVMIYDLALLAPSLLVVVDWAARNGEKESGRADLLVYCLYVALLLPLGRLHVQVSVPLMFWILGALAGAWIPHLPSGRELHGTSAVVAAGQTEEGQGC